MLIKVNSEQDLVSAARQFIDAIGDGKHIAFLAPMGAGKTTFISAICHELGVTDDVNSPTFSIINEYRDADNNPIYHFDFYRIENEAQCEDLGLDEYFDSDALCLMEWPENAEAFLPEDTMRVKITVDADGTRTIEL